jgi:hypothetical protein
MMEILVPKISVMKQTAAAAPRLYVHLVSNVIRQTGFVRHHLSAQLMQIVMTVMFVTVLRPVTLMDPARPELLWFAMTATSVTAVKPVIQAMVVNLVQC